MNQEWAIPAFVDVYYSDTTLVRAGVWTRTASVSRATRGNDLSVCLISLNWGKNSLANYYRLVFIFFHYDYELPHKVYADLKELGA